MVRITIVVFFVIVFFSCKQENKYSGDHLSRDVMQKVMLDINLAEAYSINANDSLHRAGTKNVDSLSAFYKRIFDHYKITEAEFTQSLEWYKNHPEELDSVYAHIIPIANKLQTRLPAAKTPPPPPTPPQGMPATPLPQSQMMHPNGIRATPHPVPQRSVDNSKEN